MSELIGKTIEQYRIDRLLGQGGMAAVYEATDTNLNRQVAIKLMHPHLGAREVFRQRFLREAQAAAILSHPNIVRVLNFGGTGANVILVMELLLGKNLRQYTRTLRDQNMRMPLSEALEIIRQIAQALQYAHERNMVHRDIKPDNVVLQPVDDDDRLPYRPILTDFGLAQITTTSDTAVTEQQAVGTYPYMSPEQCNAEAVDLRTDIYALGIMLYEITVGQLPFNPKNIAEAAQMHGRMEVPSPSSVVGVFPQELERIILKALAKRPVDRYQSAAEMGADIEALLKPVKRLRLEEAPIILNEGDDQQTVLETTINDYPLSVQPPFDLPARRQQEVAEANLVFYTPQGSFVVPVRNAVTRIGRELDQEVKLKGIHVSRAHLIVEREPNGRFTVVDQSSRNGTWLEDRRLRANVPALLNAYDVVRFGEYWMQLLPAIDFMNREREEVADEDFESLMLSTEAGEGYETKLMGIVPAEARPPMEPPRLTVEQMEHDRLIIYRAGQEPRIFSLTDRHYLVGRGKKRHIQLDGEFASRIHARIDRRADGNYYITDLDSTNGVWFDNERIRQRTAIVLPDARVIRMGAFYMRYEQRAGRVLAADDSGNEGDQYNTVAMVKPLDAVMPYYSEPPISREMRAADRLILFSEDHPIQIVKIEKQIITVGRGSNQDIKVRGKRVSRNHLLIELATDGNIYVTDSHSRNGTWVGDTMLVPDTQVLWNKNDIIRIGNYWMKFIRGDQNSMDIGVLSDRHVRVGKTIGNFRIDRYLGENSLVAVYKAVDLQLSRDVALRMLHPEIARDPVMKQRFLEEARVLSRLEHPNIIQVQSYYTLDGETFLVMDLVTGGTLRGLMQRIRDEGRIFEVSEAAELMSQIASGLHYAHQQGLIHRDLRPEGIVLRSTTVVGPIKKYEPVLTDLTLARYSDSGEVFENEAFTAFAYAYMSPEQTQNNRVDVRSDVYELGVLLYEMLAGLPPFVPNSLAEAVQMHAREPIPAIGEFRANVPLEIEAVINRTLAKNPNDRYQTAGEMARALDRAMTARAVNEQEDRLKTVVMDLPLPAEMPPRTEPPATAEDLELDRIVFFSDTQPTVVMHVRKDLYTIGRDANQDIVLPSKNISRRHARIERSSDNLYRIIDIGSRNGSWLGTYRLLSNIAEIWDASETARIGDYWVRIERAGEKRASASSLLPYLPAAIPEEYSTDAGDGAPPRDRVHQPTVQEQVRVTVDKQSLTVAPGERAALAIEISNQSDYVDHFMIEVVGLPADWYTVPSEELYLLPFNRETASIQFHPPLSSQSTAGAHAFEIRVSSRAKRINAVRTQGALNILPVHSYKTELFPERLRGAGVTELFIANTGNTAETYSIQARDREQAVNFQLEGRQYRLMPGQEALIAIKVKPRRRIWIGTEQSLPFKVSVSPTPPAEDNPPQQQDAEVMVRPACGTWVITAGIILLALLTVAAVFAATQVVAFIGGQATATVVAAATEIVVTQTAVALEDADGDGLSNAREAELTTDPILADTDGDGLSDGEEVRVWGTNPLMRDSDGDGLTDGDEALTLGTNPLEKDTDGDGVPDNEDSFPTLRATPTITPFPTIPGSVGDVCPGSPIPSRLAAGMRGQVEPGGVANRVREEPDPESEIVGYLDPGSQFLILDGPTCDEAQQLRWWKIDFNGLQGWTAEGIEDEYYLCPPDDCEGGEGGGEEASSDTSRAPSSIEYVSITPPAPSTVSLDHLEMGVQVEANLSDGDWNTLMLVVDPLNMGWIKVQANWRFLQPEGPGTRSMEYQNFINHIRSASGRGYRVLISIAKAPDWARSITGQDGPPDNPADLAQFVQQMLEDSGGAISAIEVWNEPNLRREWNGTLAFNGGGYMRLFRAVHSVVQQQAPQVTVITAGLAPTGTSEESVNDRDFLWQMYRTGLASFANVGIGVHPYSWGNAPDAVCCDPVEGRFWDDQPQFFLMNNLSAVRNIMVAHGHNRARIWTTEFGWTSWQDLGGSPPEEWMNYVSPQQQGVYALRAFEIGQSLDYMGPMFLWNLNFANPRNLATRNEVAGFSLVVFDETRQYRLRAGYQTISNREQ